MDLKPIRTRREYQAALREAEALWDSEPGSPEGDRLEVLVLLIGAFEAARHPIEDPDPIEFLEHVMESRGFTRKDLEPYIGSRARVSEILNRTRPLSLEMIRRLAEGLKLPAEVLIRRYELAVAA